MAQIPRTYPPRNNSLPTPSPPYPVPPAARFPRRRFTIPRIAPDPNPQITAKRKTFTFPPSADLRQVLLAHSIPVHNDQAVLINCRGLGTCGTCAVEIEGEVSPPGWREQPRLSLPPHHSGTTCRLACQVKVLGDATITKFSGFWGQGQERRWWMTFSPSSLAWLS